MGVRRLYEQISLVLSSGRTVDTAGRGDVRMPIHCTALGKAIVAFEPLFLGELLPYYRFVPYTSRTITEPARFRAELRRVQTCGFACDNEEYKPGFRCVAAPIRDVRGRVIAALSVSGTTFRRSTSGIRNSSFIVCRRQVKSCPRQPTSCSVPQRIARSCETKLSEAATLFRWEKRVVVAVYHGSDSAAK